MGRIEEPQFTGVTGFQVPDRSVIVDLVAASVARGMRVLSKEADVTVGGMKAVRVTASDVTTYLTATMAFKSRSAFVILCFGRTVQQACQQVHSTFGLK
jgi:hypothetical protein